MVILSIALTVAMTIVASAQQSVPIPQINPGKPVETSPSPSLEKPPEPKRIYQSACPALLNGAITAKPILPIVEGECGERSPLAVSAILAPDKSALSSSPQINCRTATALVEWTSRLNEASIAAFDVPVDTIVTGNGYQCRRRNNLPDGKISEHGFANAIDIMGFKLADGTDILVERDWGEPGVEPDLNGLFLRTIHKQACTIFTTVLGPDTNEHHKDHFHLDLGCHGKGCTYRICE